MGLGCKRKQVAGTGEQGSSWRLLSFPVASFPLEYLPDLPLVECNLGAVRGDKPVLLEWLLVMEF